MDAKSGEMSFRAISDNSIIRMVSTGALLQQRSRSVGAFIREFAGECS